jgi:NTP pyrophosphatase (non-canonical NTP hydrolase)
MVLMSNLAVKIKDYYEKRQLVHPTVWEALGWVSAELGEVYEVLMSWNPKWVRNNPQDHPVKSKEDLAEELGDVIFMLVMAGLSEGVDPIEALEKKMERKLQTASFKSTMEIIEGEPE